MSANYDDLLTNSSWLTHVATSDVARARGLRILRVWRLSLRQRGAIRPGVRRVLVACLLIAWLQSIALAEPQAPDSAAPDPAVTPAASARGGEKSPWIDLAPATVLEHVAEQPHADHKLAAGITMGAMYTVFSGWMYLAWYNKHKPLSQYKWGGDGWLGSNTYAGGADKFGHAWSTMSLSRLSTVILSDWGGYDHTKSSLVSAGLAEALFIGVEVKDGFFYEFSFSDLTGDTVGAALALLLDNFPRLDELFDYRVQYWPSQMYLRKLNGSSPCPSSGCSRWDIAEDYSGETYLLAFHLGGIHALRDMKYGTISRFVDLAVGFDTRGYKPTPDADLMQTAHQHLFFGVSLNAQGLIDYFVGGKPRKVGHAVFEVFNVPFTSQPLATYSTTPTGTVAAD